MRRLTLALALFSLATFAAAPAHANMCKAGPLSCATGMPIGGYCQCTARGATEDGEVVAGTMSRKPVNAKAGGCGTNPKAPGCH